jgi:cytochrome c biogenesis protein CcmG, thiol:disulfide interchange protein DsbE
MAPTVRLSILLLGLSFFLSCSSPGLEENAGGPAVQGQVAPNFSFNDRSGKRLSLADFRGKVVLINFWATWCPPCRDEMPSMQSLQRQMDRNEFAILALSVDDSWDQVNQFINQSGLDLPVYADFDKKISSLYGTFKFPETYVLDREGILALKVIGPTDWAAPEMLSFLRKLTSETSS